MHGKTLRIDPNAAPETTVVALKALASVPRWRLLQCLGEGGRTINELAEMLSLPASTTAAHIKILEEAGLIRTELQAAVHGLQKFCTRSYDNVTVSLPMGAAKANDIVELAMPIGAYTTSNVQPTCGLASSTSLIGFLDDPLSYYEPERVHAGLLWFRSGYLEYVFPNRLPISARLLSVQVSMEICSEAPLHNNEWPSDITVWINGKEVGTWTSPADFGADRGALTPAWWDTNDTQYGLLKRWLVNHDGAYIDGYKLSQVTINDVGIAEQPTISVRVGVKGDALHVGGINLFGRTFGNYPQDLLLRMEYRLTRSG